MGKISAWNNEIIKSADRKSAVERLIKPRDLRDLAVIISTCGSKDNTESNRIPRSEIVSTLSTPFPCSVHWKATDGGFFLWNVITLHFEGLIWSRFSSDQVQTASRSRCNFSASSWNFHNFLIFITLIRQIGWWYEMVYLCVNIYPHIPSYTILSAGCKNALSRRPVEERPISAPVSRTTYLSARSKNNLSRRPVQERPISAPDWRTT